MKLVTVMHRSSDRPGLVTDRQVVDLRGLTDSVLGLIQTGVGSDEVAEFVGVSSPPRHPLDAVELRAPIARPAGNVLCLGMNYAAHVTETSADFGTVPELPTLTCGSQRPRPASAAPTTIWCWTSRCPPASTGRLNSP